MDGTPFTILTTTFIISAVLAGVAFAGLDFSRKKLLEELPATVILVWLVAATFSFFGIWFLVAPQTPLRSGYFPPAILSVAMNVLANLLFLKAISISPLSRTIPFLSLSPAFAAMSAFFVVGEVLEPEQWGGVLCVVAGALTLNSSAGVGGAFSGVLRALRRERGSLLMIVTAICWGIAAPFDKIAVSRASISAHACFLSGGVGVVLLVVLVLRREHRGLLAVGSCRFALGRAMAFAVCALGIQLIAYQEGFVGLAETIKRVIGMVSALALGSWVFGEKILPSQYWAVGLMSLGVALVL